MFSSSMTKFLLFLSISAIFSAGTTNAKVKLPPGVTVPAVMVFGDSIVDAGMNNNLNTLIRCNFPPYGADFNGGIPTGRFCNGRVPSDMIAEEIGVKSVVPAYLDPTLQPQDLLTGVTFASGGTGYDSLTPKLASVFSLSEQLDYFREYIGKLKALVGEEKTNFILANAIYIVVAGSDDIANTYFVLGARKLQYDIPAYTDLMANSASDFLKQLYQFGARRIGVFSAPPIGCVPSQRTLAGGLARECSGKYNDAALLFNQKISPALKSLSESLPDTRLVYIDVYTPLLDIINYPNKYGFEVANKGCCGTGNIEVAVLCNKLTPPCPDVTNYVFWDSYHPTEKTYSILVSELIPKVINKFF